MQTLTYGLKVPDNGDTGADVFPAIEDNITQLDGHTHNGTNSSKLTTASSNVVTASVASGSWSATSSGNYRQAITLPAGLQFDNIHVEMKLTSGHQVLAKIEKISSSQYYVYTNDSATAFTAVYSS